ncbi:MAG: hypothetical protein KGD64_07810 [Candidatus Heimdallarchaeota archaeon]|nr:hypothetical protein [Candidatus Heimdallarchaeota archaeon]
MSQQLQKLAQKYIEEFIKCKASFDYYCRNYVLIELPGRDEKLIPYRKQTELIDLIEFQHYVLVLKSRQIGISTIIQAYSSWLTVFYDNVVIGIISKDGREATDFARAVRGIVEKLPDWMKPLKGILGRGFAKRTEQSFILTNGSKVFASPVNPNAPEKTLRGKAITFLVIDEAAFVHYIDTAWTSMVPALSTNQMQARKANIPFGTIVLSTPNKTIGVGQWYFERYLKSISGDDIFKPFVIHWKMIPELCEDPEWYDTQCRLFDHDKKKIAQELELKFLPAEGSFFEADTVEKMQEGAMVPLEKVKLYNGEIWTFSPPIPATTYIIGVDTAPEHGTDKSAITVWDYTTLEQVWEYQGKCKVLDFVNVVKVAATTYKNSVIVVESNSYGNQVVEHLNASEYSPQLYKEKRGKDTLVPGLSTNSKTRPLMIDALYSYMTQYPESVKSERLALELTGLVSKASGKVEADTGCTDDIALSAALCFYVRKYDPPLALTMNMADGSMITSDLKDVLNLNIGHSDVEFTDQSIMNYIKNKPEENLGYIDTISFFKG